MDAPRPGAGGDLSRRRGRREGGRASKRAAHQPLGAGESRRDGAPQPRSVRGGGHGKPLRDIAPRPFEGIGDRVPPNFTPLPGRACPVGSRECPTSARGDRALQTPPCRWHSTSAKGCGGIAATRIGPVVCDQEKEETKSTPLSRPRSVRPGRPGASLVPGPDGVA